MNITEAIESRRSIRNFKDTPVPEDILRRLADAGSSRPVPAIYRHGNFSL